jgi:pilus biogenesis lipoprotein CpaD
MTIRRKFEKRAGIVSLTMTAVALAGLAPIAGCGTPEQTWASSAAPKENRVERVTYDHRIGFEPNSFVFSVAEKQRFEKFLNEIGVGYADEIRVGIVGSVEQDQKLSDKRLEAITAYLRNNGVDHLLMSARHQGKWDGAITVTVGRYIVTPPACPNWEKPTGYDFSNTEMSNLGCATATNFGLMLADPGDLVRTRRSGPGDGTTQAKAIENFRSGKVAKAGASITGTAGPDTSKSGAGVETRTEGGD